MTVALSEIAVAIESGFACGKEKLIPDGLPHIRPFNISDSTALDLTTLYRVPFEEAPNGRAELRTGDILFNNTNSVELVGKTALVADALEAGFSNHMTRIRLDQERAEPAYVAAFLNKLWRDRYFEARATRWVSQAAFNGDALRRLAIPLPPIEEQRRIAAALDRAARLVKLHKQAAAKTRDLIPALFIDMFGDPATNPKGWPVLPLSGVIGSVQGGKNLQAGDDGDSPYRILKVSAVTRGEYAEAESKPAPADLEPPAHHIVKRGDLLFSRANTYELVGASALVEETDGATLLPDKLWRLVPAESIEPLFLWALLQSKDVRHLLSEASSGTSGSMRNISQAKLLALRLPIPPHPQQKTFSRCATAMRGMASSARTSVASAEELQRVLLSEVFT